jgi:hypothetical protein
MNRNQHRKVEGSMKKVILSVIVIAAMFSLLQAVPFQTLGMLRTRMLMFYRIKQPS